MSFPIDVSVEGGQQSAWPHALSESAFERFHVETFAELWSFARHICGDESEAQDVCQLAYIGVHRYWSEGRLREEPRRLLYRIAQRAAIDVLRSRGRRLRLFQRLQPLDDSSAWMGIELRDALDRLRPADAALVVLHTSAGLTYEELAALQGQTVGAVRSRLHRARAALRSKLRGE